MTWPDLAGMDWNATAREVVYRLGEDHGLSSDEAWEAADRALVKLEAYQESLAQTVPAEREEIVTKADFEDFLVVVEGDADLVSIIDRALAGDSECIQVGRAAILRHRREMA